MSSQSTCSLPLAGVALLLAASAGFAQPVPSAPPAPDTIIFTNGDKLAGQFVRSTASSVTFKSEILGAITVDWSKVKELHTSGKVAVIRKGVELRRHSNPAEIPQGTLAVENQNVHLTAPPQPTIPLNDVNVIVDQPGFEKALSHHPGFVKDWGGAVTLGASVVKATQESKTFNGAINLVRAEPAETWLSPRDRTSLNLSAAYGDLSQPNTPTVKTSILHGDLERDEYFHDGVFVFGQAAYDHNYSQGLDLQQVYGGGVGWTVLHRAAETLDLKGSMNYVQQQFHGAANQDLIGSTFAEHFTRDFKRLVLDQHLSVTPAWNNLDAYSALFSSLVTMPAYKRLSVSTGVIDTFLNNPPPGFQKNSFQFTLGLTYNLR